MRSAYLRHLRETADGGCHASAMKQGLCMPPSVFSLSTQLLALVCYTQTYGRYSRSSCLFRVSLMQNRYASSNCPSWLSLISITIQAHPGASLSCYIIVHVAGCQVVRKSYLRPHAARGHRVKLQRQKHTERRTTDNTNIR